MRHERETLRFWLFALGQGALWTLLPTFIFHNLPLDAIEGLALGQGLPLGTDKGPPLQAWLLQGAALIGGQSDAGVYALSALCLVVTYLAVWQLGKMLMLSQVALLGTMAMGSCFYFATMVPEFSSNFLQMPLYALCGLFFWRAACGNRLLDWSLLGLCAGLGLWTKYSFVLMLAGIGLFVMVDHQARRLWYYKGAWLAVLIALLVFVPHYLWLAQNNWLPLGKYHLPQDHGRSFVQMLTNSGLFALNQLLVITPVAIILWLARDKFAPRVKPDRYLSYIAWAPFILKMLATLGEDAQPIDMSGIALWPFVGIWLANRWNSHWHSNGWARGLLLFTILLTMPLSLLVGARYSSALGYSPWRTQFLGRELAQTAELLWVQQGYNAPLRVVLGDAWLSGNISWYGRDRPLVSINGSIEHSPWVGEEEIKHYGAAAVWDLAQSEAMPSWGVASGNFSERHVITLEYAGVKKRIAFAFLAPQAPQADK